jgi:uncharacterized membrane protein YagU involved in acid resistance
MQPPPLRTVLTAGLIAGLLDITAACIKFYSNTGKGPAPVLQFVASGIFGKKAFTGGNEMLAWGLFFHFLIAVGFATLYVLLFRQYSFIRKNSIVSGIVYGVVAWSVMNLLVIPLSHAPAQPFVLKKAVISLLIIVFMIGLPIALITRKMEKEKE